MNINLLMLKIWLLKVISSTLLTISSSATVHLCFLSIVLTLQDILSCTMDTSRHSDSQSAICSPFVLLMNHILLWYFYNSYQLIFLRIQRYWLISKSFIPFLFHTILTSYSWLPKSQLVEMTSLRSITFHHSFGFIFQLRYYVLLFLKPHQFQNHPEIFLSVMFIHKI